MRPLAPHEKFRLRMGQDLLSNTPPVVAAPIPLSRCPAIATDTEPNAQTDTSASRQYAVPQKRSNGPGLNAARQHTNSYPKNATDIELPGKIPCRDCGVRKDCIAFSKKNVNKLKDLKRKLPDYDLSQQQDIGCMDCKKNQKDELECWDCGETQDRECFNKTQRKAEEPVCEECQKKEAAFQEYTTDMTQEDAEDQQENASGEEDNGEGGVGIFGTSEPSVNAAVAPTADLDDFDYPNCELNDEEE